MVVFLIIFFGVFVVDADVVLKKKLEERKIIQTNTSKTTKKSIIPEIKIELEKQEKIVAEVKPELKEPTIIKEDIKPEPKKLEIINNKIKIEPKEPAAVKEEINTRPEEPAIIKEEVKQDLIIEESNNTKNLDKSEIGWLKLILYILGPILIVIMGKRLFTRMRNKSSQNKTSNYMRREFKDEPKLDTSEQQPAQEETQSDPSEQQPAQEETQSETNDEKLVEDDENNKK